MCSHSAIFSVESAYIGEAECCVLLQSHSEIEFPFLDYR